MLGQVNERLDSDTDAPLPIYDIVEEKKEILEVKSE